MSDVLVRAEGLGKSYPKTHRSGDRLRALGRLLVRNIDTDRTSVLEGVDLCIRRGESLGLIGDNGAGKSTLLKLVTGVLTPSQGRVVVNGSIGALLELGAGFHPEYSGRDNIAMAAALHGLDGASLREALPGIIAFADIGRYIDEPIKHYSSGMVVRLGFAIIASLKPDLLVTDEVLAVGDESFQKKCVAWITAYLDAGGTLILVSHSMYHVQKLCRHACWLRAGKVELAGDVFEVTQTYLAYHERKSAAAAEAPTAERLGGQEFTLTTIKINGSESESPSFLDADAPLAVRVHIRSRDGRTPGFAVGVVRADGTSLYGLGSDMEGVAPIRNGTGDYVYEIAFSNMSLLPGSYAVRAHAMDTEGVRVFDTLERAFVVRGTTRELGLVRLPHRWTHAGDART